MTLCINKRWSTYWHAIQCNYTSRCPIANKTGIKNLTFSLRYDMSRTERMRTVRPSLSPKRIDLILFWLMILSCHIQHCCSTDIMRQSRTTICDQFLWSGSVNANEIFRIIVVTSHNFTRDEIKSHLNLGNNLTFRLLPRY